MFTGAILSATSSENGVHVYTGARIARTLYGDNAPAARALLLDDGTRAPRDRLDLVAFRRPRRSYPPHSGTRNRHE